MLEWWQCFDFFNIKTNEKKCVFSNVFALIDFVESAECEIDRARQSQTDNRQIRLRVKENENEEVINHSIQSPDIKVQLFNSNYFLRV